MTFPQMNATEFLTAVWPGSGPYCIALGPFVSKRSGRSYFRHFAFDTAAEAARFATVSSLETNSYFAIHALKPDYEKDGYDAPRRRATNMASTQCFHGDLDCGWDDKQNRWKPYKTKNEAREGLVEFCAVTGLPIPMVVDSGNGLHTYWLLTEPMTSVAWKPYAEKLEKLAEHHGLIFDNQCTTDAARVLRVVGTFNRKDPNNPKTVKLRRPQPERFVTSEFLALIDKAFEALPAPEVGPAPTRARGNLRQSSAHEIIKHCPTIAHFAEVRGAVSEPFWRSAIGVVKHTVDGEALCHEWSKGDPRYDKTETQHKIDKWTTGATLCATFRELADTKCHGCEQTCRSPFALGCSKDTTPLEAALHDLNSQYFVARIGGSVFVFDENDNSILPNGMKFPAFRQFHAGMILNGQNLPQKWLPWPQRRTYNSVVFNPSGECAQGAYNTWRGLAVEPVQGECGLILAHIRDIWCSGDGRQFEYVMCWLAQLVQTPWIKPEVALVLRSKEGTGKTIIVQMLLDFVGVHGFAAAQKEQVAGRFNGHLFDKTLVILEEAFFAGDPAAVAVMKALITNPTIGYEAKGKDAFSAPNYAHVISLTNNAWAVPAGEDTRRWMVLDISEERLGDQSHFVGLAAEIKRGGAKAFLHHLLSIDLTGFNPRVLPPSKALRVQQVETLMRTDPVAAWWLHVLSEGSISNDWHVYDWNAEIPASELKDNYTKFTARFRTAPVWDVAAKKLRRLLPPSGLQKSRKVEGLSRTFVYTLPDLSEARQAFENATGVNPCAA